MNKSQDRFRIMYKYKGHIYQSTSYFKTIERAQFIGRKHVDAVSVIWLKYEDKSERLVYCFDLVREVSV